MEQNQLATLPTEAETPPAETPPDETSPVEATGPETLPEETPPVDETPDPSKLQSEIDKLKETRQKAEADAIYWRKQKAEARADYFRDKEKGRDEKPATPPGIGPEPTPDQFEDYNKYVAALTDHRVRVAKAEWDRDAKRRDEEKTQRERHENLQIKLQEGYQKYDDFEEITFDRTATHITPMIVDILADCDHPADVAYHLAKNRVEGVAISRMTPLQAARAIAKLEISLSGGSPPSGPSKSKTTNAPPPITPIGSGGSSGVATKDPEKMSQKEYNEWRESQGARRY